MEQREFTRYGWVEWARCCRWRSAPLWVVGLCLIAVAYGAPPEVAYSPAEEIGQLEKETIKESSGMAPSWRSKERFWTHNDSGDDARLYAFGPHGEHQGTSKVKRAGNEDWEAIDSYQLNGQPYLMVGDIGDNLGRRPLVSVHVIPEPVDPSDDSQAVAQVDFRYEGGPVDCEAMSLDTDRRELYLVEKQLRHLTSRVYVLPWPEKLPIGVKPADRPVLEAKLIGSIPQIAVTDMAFSADNQHLVINTYGDLYVYSRDKTETWRDGLARPPLRIRGPARRQGEAVCFDHDTLDILLTSEGTQAPLWRIRPLAPRQGQ